MLRVCSLAGEERVVFTGEEFEGQSVQVLKTLAAKQIGVPRFRQRWLSEDHLELSDDTIMMSAGDVQLVVSDFVQAEYGDYQKLFDGCKRNYVDQVDELLRKPLDPNAMFVDEMVLYWSDYDFEGRTALHVAALSNCSECVALLLEADADTDATINGETAWQLAAKEGHFEVMMVLLEAGVDPDAIDCTGRTALHLAAWDGGAGRVRLLLESRADADAVDGNGKIALDLAIERSKLIGGLNNDLKKSLNAVIRLLGAQKDPWESSYGGELSSVHCAQEKAPVRLRSSPAKSLWFWMIFFIWCM